MNKPFVRSTTAERPPQSNRTAVPGAGRSETWQTNCQLGANIAESSSSARSGSRYQLAGSPRTVA